MLFGTFVILKPFLSHDGSVF